MQIQVQILRQLQTIAQLGVNSARVAAKIVITVGQLTGQTFVAQATVHFEVVHGAQAGILIGTQTHVETDFAGQVTGQAAVVNHHQIIGKIDVGRPHTHVDIVLTVLESALNSAATIRLGDTAQTVIIGQVDVGGNLTLLGLYRERTDSQTGCQNSSSNVLHFISYP